MITATDFHIPKTSKPGEIWFFIELSGLESHKPNEVIALVRSMGYVPELRYLEGTLNAENQLSVALLLHYEQQNPDTMPQEFEDAMGEKLLNDWEQLASTLKPGLNARLRRGTQPSLVVTA